VKQGLNFDVKLSSVGMEQCDGCGGSRIDRRALEDGSKSLSHALCFHRFYCLHMRKRFPFGR